MPQVQRQRPVPAHRVPRDADPLTVKIRPELGVGKEEGREFRREVRLHLVRIRVRRDGGVEVEGRGFAKVVGVVGARDGEPARGGVGVEDGEAEARGGGLEEAFFGAVVGGAGEAREVHEDGDARGRGGEGGRGEVEVEVHGGGGGRGVVGEFEDLAAEGADGRFGFEGGHCGGWGGGGVVLVVVLFCLDKGGREVVTVQVGGDGMY